MSNYGAAPGDPEERPGWLYPLILFGITAIIAAAILVWYLAPDVEEFTGTAIRPTSEAQAIDVALGQRRFAIPSNYIRRPADRAGGAMSSIELDALLPDMHGFNAGDAEALKNVTRTSPVISIILSDGAPALSERERFERIYTRNAEPGAQPQDQAGFKVVTMASNSGYAGQKAYTRTSGDDLAVILCTADDDEYDIGGQCQREMAWGEGMTLTYIFRSGHRNDWEALDGGVKDLVARFETAAAK